MIVQLHRLIDLRHYSALIRRWCAGAEPGGGGPPRLQVPVCPADTQMDNTPLLSFQGRYVRYSNAAFIRHPYLAVLKPFNYEKHKSHYH